MTNSFKNLVFEGGGVKGIAYGGAIRRLKELGVLESVSRVAGTSAGSIAATLLALGYDADEVAEIISNTNFAEFADDDKGFFKDLFRLMSRFGWHRGDKFQKWISKHIANRFHNPNLTFAELKTLSNNNEGVKDLYVVGSNLTLQRSEIYSYETHPEMRIAEAVRISMSIPFYFQAVFNRDRDVLVDGGVIHNYPINLFDDKKYLSSNESGFVFNGETLGFRLIDKENQSLRDPSKMKPKRITGIGSFALSLFSFLQSAAARVHVSEEDWNRTVAIDSSGIGVTDFDLTQDEINTLIENGRSGVDKHFEWRNKSHNQAIGV